MPQVKDTFFLKEPGHDPRMPGQSIDEDDVALIDPIELLRIPGFGKSLAVHRLAVPKDSLKGVPLSVSRRRCELLEVRKGIDDPRQDPFRFLALDKDASHAVNSVRRGSDT